MCSRNRPDLAVHFSSATWLFQRRRDRSDEFGGIRKLSLDALGHDLVIDAHLEDAALSGQKICGD